MTVFGPFGILHHLQPMGYTLPELKPAYGKHTSWTAAGTEELILIGRS